MTGATSLRKQSTKLWPCLHDLAILKLPTSGTLLLQAPLTLAPTGSLVGFCTTSSDIVMAGTKEEMETEDLRQGIQPVRAALNFLFLRPYTAPRIKPTSSCVMMTMVGLTFVMSNVHNNISISTIDQWDTRHGISTP